MLVVKNHIFHIPPYSTAETQKMVSRKQALKEAQKTVWGKMGSMDTKVR